MAKANPIILNQTVTTVLVFRPEIHSGGVRGDLIRYKKEKGKKLEKIEEKDFRSLQLHEGVHIELNTESLRILVQNAQNLQLIIANEGIKPGEQEYIVADADEVVLITDKNKKAIFDQLLEANLPNEFWDAIKAKDPEIADKLAAGHVQLKRRKVIEELKNRLKAKFSETAGTDSWQRWIYNHSWLFGANYKDPIEKVKINLSGIMPDYLFPTIEGFVDVLEIKLPESEVIIQDANHKGSWHWAVDTTKAIGQVVNYLQTIETNSLIIERHLERELDLKVSTIKPRGYILIGNSALWSDDKKEGLRKLNSYLHHIEVITYQDLINRGNAFITVSEDI